MKFIGLVFDYDIKKMSHNIGRKWAPREYKGKEFIFAYSAASVATVLYHNPNIEYRIYTDDPSRLKEEISRYNVPTNNLSLVDWKEQLEEYKQHKYPFNCLLMLLRHNDFFNQEDFIKLDNDLIALKPCDITLTAKDCVAWKYERRVSEGDTRWGEILICNTVLGTTNFPIYNMGTLGLSKSNHFIIEESIELTNKLVDVNILPVTDVEAPIYHCAEQTAQNWNFYKHGLNVIQSYPYFDHHFDSKIKCINGATHLLK